MAVGETKWLKFFLANILLEMKPTSLCQCIVIVNQQ